MLICAKWSASFTRRMREIICNEKEFQVEKEKHNHCELYTIMMNTNNRHNLKEGTSV